MEVRGKRRKDTVLICLSQDDVEEGKIALNKGTRLMGTSRQLLTNSRPRKLCYQDWRSLSRLCCQRHQVW